MSQDPKNPTDVTFDFFRFMDDTIRREEVKKKVVIPTPGNNEPFNPNKEYLKRYGHSIADRMWIGKRRY